jgi:hypothetical protein
MCLIGDHDDYHERSMIFGLKINQCSQTNV